jgi:hypothetical protein
MNLARIGVLHRQGYACGAIDLKPLDALPALGVVGP